MRFTLAMAGVLSAACTIPLAAQDVYRVSDQVTQPTLVEMSKPLYDAWVFKRLSGVVRLEIDVMANGTVGTVALLRSSGVDLDRIAVDAARRIRFAPGTRNGTPVAVRLAVDLELDSRATPPMRVTFSPQPSPN